MAKKVNPSTDVQQQTSNVPLFEDFYDYNQFKRKPINIEGIQTRAKGLLEWAKTNPDALSIYQWYDIQGISNETVDRWSERCPEFKQAVSMARRAIGTRREIGGLKKQFSESMVQNSMPMYSDEWRSLFMWREGLKSKTIEDGKSIVNVLMQRYILEAEEKGV